MKKIDRRIWNSYILKLSKINEAAADEMWSWIAKHSVYDLDEMIEFAYALVVKYGEASAALSAEMYDLTVELAEKHYPPAIPAAPPDKREVAEAITETAKSENPKLISYSVSRMVKVTGVDTTMQNALRDGAEWAWIPIGETCAFCLTLASRGWQKASDKAIRNGHASHIHANCNCTYAVRFDDSMDVEGYDPATYYDLYASFPGDSRDKINAIRRRLYSENAGAINAQKREAYRLRQERRQQKQ